METKTVVWARRGVLATAAVCIAWAAYESRRQFIAWHADPYLGIYLIPPFRHIGYFIRYSFNRFFLQYAISAVAAFAFYVGARRINAQRGGIVFEPEEPYFLAIGLMASGHPGWIFYLLLVFGAYFLALAIASAVHGPQARVSFYYFWLPCALVTVALNAYLRQYAWYANLLI